MANRADNFNRSDVNSPMGTPSDGGSDWTYPGTTLWGISSNQAFNFGQESQSIAVLEASSATVEVQATLSTISADGGLCARVVDNSNYIVVAATAGVSYRLFKQVAGSFTQLGSTYATSPANGDVIKLVCNGSNIEVFVGGVSRITAIEGAHSTATKHGLRCNGDQNTRYDDFSITDLGGGANTKARPYYTSMLGRG